MSNECWEICIVLDELYNIEQTGFTTVYDSNSREIEDFKKWKNKVHVHMK